MTWDQRCHPLLPHPFPARRSPGLGGVGPRPARAELRLVRFAMHAPLATWFPLEMLDGIGDVAPLPIEARRLQRLVENATGWADERRTGEILVVARLFA